MAVSAKEEAIAPAVLGTALVDAGTYFFPVTGAVLYPPWIGSLILFRLALYGLMVMWISSERD